MESPENDVSSSPEIDPNTALSPANPSEDQVNDSPVDDPADFQYGLFNSLFPEGWEELRLAMITGGAIAARRGDFVFNANGTPEVVRGSDGHIYNWSAVVVIDKAR